MGFVSLLPSTLCSDIFILRRFRNKYNICGENETRFRHRNDSLCTHYISEPYV
jgi:hypothetical protein